MKLTGIMKLRLLVILLFAMMIISISLSFIAVIKEGNDTDDFIDSLTDDEIDQLGDIYSKYPESDYSGLYSLSGWLIYIVTGGLFFLMLRVWKTNNIH